MPLNKARHLSQYRADWESFISKLETNGSQNERLLDLRRSAWEEFERIGFPTHRRGNELWKYTDLRAVDAHKFFYGTKPGETTSEDLTELIPRSDSWINLVFIDGVFCAELSDSLHAEKGVRLETIQSGAFGDASLGSELLGTVSDFKNDAFASLNTAFLSDGLIIAVDAEVELESPISVAFVNTDVTEHARAIYPRIFVDVSEQSVATLIECHVALTDDAYLTAPVVEANLGVGSALRQYRVQLESEASYHLSTTRVRQLEGSSYASTSFSLGSDIGRNEIHTVLDGEHASSTLHGIYLTTNSQHQVHEISTSHNCPHGTSNQYYKGILSGSSQAVFSGSIMVARGAQKTEAEQADLNLLLSHDAEVDTKPSLEIYADDVKCAHGATAGHVNEDTLFYLQSRGIEYDTAQAMLIRGFAAEILDEVEEPDLHQFLSNTLDRIMPALQASSDTVGTT